MRSVPELEPASPGPAAARDLARAFRARFGASGKVHALRSVNMVSFPCPVVEALGSAAGPIPGWVTLAGRMLIVQFDDFEGRRRTLVWEPWLAEAVETLPVLAHRPAYRGPVGSGRLAPAELCRVSVALERFGLSLSDVDLVAFGDLRGHDLTRIAGTTRASLSEHEPRAPLFSDAIVLLRSEALDALRMPHPLQSPWYVPRGGEDVIAERTTVVEGNVELGPGIALVSTPGRTAGHQSLVLNTLEGIWVISGNGVASDCWQPLLSKIPGIRRAAEREGREVIVGGADEPLRLYESLVLERSLADVSHADPRWLSILPSAELTRVVRQWPAVPTFAHVAVDHGVIELPSRS